MQTLALATPEPRKQLGELRQKIAGYRRAIPDLERRIKRARKTQPDTEAVRAALDAASLKLAAAKEDLAALEREARGFAKTLGKVR